MAYKVNLHITQKCNYACKYCFAHFDHDNDLNLDQWKHIIDNLKASGLVDAINFAGGEPVLHRDFATIVNYAYDQGFKLSIITNGSLMLNPKLMPPELVVPENDLTRSYIMVDNQGRLLDDETEEYKVVGSLLTEDFVTVFDRYSFDEVTYASRYAG